MSVSENASKLSDLIVNYIELDDVARELEASLAVVRAQRDAIKYTISDQMADIGARSMTDEQTRHRATVYEDKRWLVTDPILFEESVRESPFLREELYVPMVDKAKAISMAIENPPLFMDIPGISYVTTNKMKITRGKGNGNGGGT